MAQEKDPNDPWVRGRSGKSNKLKEWRTNPFRHIKYTFGKPKDTDNAYYGKVNKQRRIRFKRDYKGRSQSEPPDTSAYADYARGRWYKYGPENVAQGPCYVAFVGNVRFNDQPPKTEEESKEETKNAAKTKP